MPLTTTVRFVDPASGAELVSYGSHTDAGILESLDIGFPNVRESKTNRSGAHGTVDTTRWMADRPITAVVTLPEQPDTDVALDNLATLLDPELRLLMYMQRPGWARERRIEVRGATLVCPPGILRKAQAGWVAPRALFEDSYESSLVLQPSGSGTGGLTFPINFPIAFGEGVVSGAAQVEVGGNRPAPFVADIYGPCSDPTIRCIDTGEQVRFAGLTLNPGEFLRVDTDAQTAVLNGLSNNSRMNKLDFATSTIGMRLPAGRSVQVAFSPTSPSGNCQAVLTWRSRWL